MIVRDSMRTSLINAVMVNDAVWNGMKNKPVPRSLYVSAATLQCSLEQLYHFGRSDGFTLFIQVIDGVCEIFLGVDEI